MRRKDTFFPFKKRENKKKLEKKFSNKGHKGLFHTTIS